MNGRWIWLVITGNLLALVGLVFVQPAAMVSPGPVVPAHSAVRSECFACHAPFRGASPDRCAKCHALGDIGVRSTKGIPLEGNAGRPVFHQELTEQDCVACHTDHLGATLGKRSRKPFSHELVRAATRDRCETCHTAPKNDLHRDLGMSCTQCHTIEHWKPAHFEHAALAKTVLDRCEACHKAPTGGSHPEVSNQCQQCHTTEHWKPAHFEHGKFFELDKHHAVACVTCHTTSDYKRYTCYGCHEHTPDKIRAEHEEEGIRNFENCVSCHKSSSGKPEHGDRGEHDNDRRKEH
jgi:hypothetical protein